MVGPISAADARYMADARSHRLVRKFNDAITAMVLHPEGPKRTVAFQEPEDDIKTLHEIARNCGYHINNMYRLNPDSPMNYWLLKISW